ncbi:MAG: efflux RND transporter periplasmic adaptor subunit [Chloroflexota bacterium]|jgi:multidrug resistance efflux pump
MKNKTYYIFACVAMLILAVLSGCDTLGYNTATGSLTASGRVSANVVNIGAEVGGRVVELNVQEGSAVEAGDVLFRIDDELLRTQENQAKAALQGAEAALKVAQAAVESARIQEDLTLQGARAMDQLNRATAWSASQPSEFNQPEWYFRKSERIQAAEAEVRAAEQHLEEQTVGLHQALEKNSNTSFVNVEERLAKAQSAFEVAVKVLDQARVASSNQTLLDTATDAHDQALKELEAAQLEYRRVLTTASADEILEARARVAVAQSRLDLAHDVLNAMQTGDQSIQVYAASAGVTQAEAAVSQAEAVLAQAKAALETIAIQIEKLTVASPISGVVLSSSLDIGEIVAPGGVVLTIGQLDMLELTVYVPVTDLGKIKIGQQVSIQVDSFPGKSYEGVVQSIADEAEFTPRNVQTVDGRRTTVFAVKIAVANVNQELKPGMPADVTFAE